MFIMENLSPKSLIIIPALATLTYLFINLLSLPNSDSREPPTAPTRIPYIGHVLGLGRRKFNYYVELSHKTFFPILTMHVPGAKMYVVNTPELIQAIQKLPKKLAFPPLIARFVGRILDISEKGREILAMNADGNEGDWGLNNEMMPAIKKALQPGPGMDDMNGIMIRNIAGSLDGLIGEGVESVRIGLARWLRDVTTMATTESIYGPRNPYRNLEVQKSFWEFEGHIMRLVIGILPSVFSRKCIAARGRVEEAFVQYFAASDFKNTSALTQARLEVNTRHGVPVEDIARYETAHGVAIMANTAPSAFWLIFFIYSNPALLEEIRQEVGAVVETSFDQDGNIIRSLDVTNVKTKCPLLLSAFQETLRHRFAGTSVRAVMEDTILDDKWLLKKNSLIQMPGRVIHMNAKIWGSDVEEFNPRRFLNDKNSRHRNPAAFRGFGGGTTLCPGRHFATNKILALVSMLVMRFEMKPVLGEWKLPKSDHTNSTIAIMQPDTDVEVNVFARKAVDNEKWALKLSNSKAITAMVAEDRVD